MALSFNQLPYPTVVIIGGGFAGLRLAKKLNKKKFRVFLLDKNNYHTFQPLLYQVATGGLGSDSIAYPFRKVIGPMPNVAYRMANVERIDTESQEVIADTGTFKYDYLVLATGAATNFFGKASIEHWSMPIKSIPDSLDIRSDLLQEFEKAMAATNTVDKQRILNFVIVGAGPTGVELAGAMAEIKTNVLPYDYTEIDPNLMTIHLIEAGPRVLSAMSPYASKAAGRFLQNMGVNVLLNTAVEEYDGYKLKLSNGTVMNTETVIWSAGVKGKTVDGLKSESEVRSRYLVDEHNRVQGYDNIFAIGDIALMKTKDFPNGHPQMAPVAIQQGTLLGKNFENIARKRALKPFKYQDKGSMATIGRHKAVVDLPFMKFKGWFAWYVWMLVHLLMLIGFRNRFVVFFNWIWNYFSYQRAIRLIIRPYKKLPPAQTNEKM
ncbi:MAG TPA: NAD(P)/FAD-dependent oxidoreductase [Bacteroidia bacterium]|nr:NAD(P)/FAD-dependent oxidoreductase [Bacteroidia bacterium]